MVYERCMRRKNWNIGKEGKEINFSLLNLCYLVANNCELENVSEKATPPCTLMVLRTHISARGEELHCRVLWPPSCDLFANFTLSSLPYPHPLLPALYFRCYEWTNSSVDCGSRAGLAVMSVFTVDWVHGLLLDFVGFRCLVLFTNANVEICINVKQRDGFKK